MGDVADSDVEGIRADDVTLRRAAGLDTAEAIQVPGVGEVAVAIEVDLDFNAHDGAVIVRA